jgi:hypothetical protein
VVLDFMENTAAISSYTHTVKNLIVNKLNNGGVRKVKSNVSLTSVASPEKALPPNATILQIEQLDMAREVKCSSFLSCFFSDLLSLQLCLIEQKFYQAIKPIELLNLGWQKKDKEVRSPNILSLTRMFNKMSNIVASEILSQDDSEKRVATVKYFVELAEICLKLNNFNALMEIIAGLGNASVHRLKKTWSVCKTRRKIPTFVSCGLSLLSRRKWNLL